MMAPRNTKRCRHRRKAISVANVPQRRMRIVQLAASTFTASAVSVSHWVRIAASHCSRSVSQRSKTRANVGKSSTPIPVATKYPTMMSQNFPVRPR